MKAYKKLHKINIGKSGMVQQNEVKNLIKIKNFKKIGEFRSLPFFLINQLPRAKGEDEGIWLEGVGSRESNINFM